MTEPLNFIYGFGMRAHMRQVNAVERMKILYRKYERERMLAVIIPWCVQIDYLFSKPNCRCIIKSYKFDAGYIKNVLEGQDGAHSVAPSVASRHLPQMGEHHLEEKKR